MGSEETTDEQLMLLVQTGNPAAFDELFRRHGAGLLGYLWRSCGDRATAEDLVQEVFLGVFRARGSYAPAARFSTWLYTIARNACVNRLKQRTRERKRTRPLVGEADCAHGIPARAGDEPQQRLQAEETGQAIADALARLAPREREVLLLREVGGLAYEELTQVTGWPMGTVKTELHRARRRLAELLHDVL